MATRPKTLLIREFIIQAVGGHPTDIASVVAKQFGMTAQAARNHLHTLEQEGVLSSEGKTRGKVYSLKPIAHVKSAYKSDGLQEDDVWSKDFYPLLTEVPPNVRNLCTIAFGEMLNNAIDHSGTDEIFVEMKYTAAMISVSIWDRGVGIFKKIKDALNLPEERMAILELSKGKMTTAPQNHSGLGIFFTSRMVDIFSIRSGALLFHHLQSEQDWLIETKDPFGGTRVDFTVSTTTEREAGDIYDQFCADPDVESDVNLAFSRTHVPIKLAQFGNEPLVSRSQAKRVLARFDKFAEVLVDFSGVEFVGQAFADELFRVFPALHPEIKVIALNANRQVTQMIRLATDPNPHQLKMFV